MSFESAVLDEETRQQLVQSITKFEDFSDVLENLTPLKGGRRPGTLVTFSKQTEDERRLIAEQVRSKFKNQLQYIDDMEDPLEVYWQHILWTRGFFPQGNTRESGLEALIRQTTDEFKDDTRYKDDPRYLKCWLERAWQSYDPKDVFYYLAEKDIGQKDTLYYKQYSIYFELFGKYTEARYVLEMGIKHQVDIEKLQKLLEQLNNRIEYNTQNRRQQEQRTPTQRQLQSLQCSGDRKMLGHKLHSEDGHSTSQREFSNRQNVTGSSRHSSNIPSATTSIRYFGNATPTATTTISHSSSSATQSTGATKFRIYQDEDPTSAAMETVFPRSRTTTATTTAAASTESSLNRSTSSFSRKRQENTVPSEPIAGAKLPQKSSLVTQPSTAFSVFRDDATPSPPSTNQRHTTTHQSRHHHDNNLRTQNSRHHRHDIVDDSMHMKLLTTRYHNKEKDYIKTKSSKGRPETIAIHDDYFGFGEFPFTLTCEELRIVKQVHRQGKPQLIEQPTNTELEMRPSEAVIHCRIGRGRSPTREYTAETKGAMESINALFNKQQRDEDDEDDEDDDTNPQKKRIRRTHVDENS